MPNITKSLIDKSQPKEKDYIIWDTTLKGFGVKVTPKGRKTYILKYVGAGGKQRKPSLGVHGSITCENARILAKEMMLKITDKVDPMSDRERNKSELLFSELFEAYIERYAKFHKKTWKYNQEYYERHIKNIIGNDQLSLITREQMQRLHINLAKTSGQSMANQVIALITTVYNKSIEWGCFEGIPPTKYVKKFKEKPRDRFLQRDELSKFFDSINQEENPDFRDFILMLIYTGQRKSNVLSMRWQDIRFDQTYWYIPETKNGEPAMIPLVNEALEILKNRKDNAINEWVFHGTGATGHLVEPKKAWRRLLERSGIENLTMHDLRRTMGSWQTINGSSPFIVAKSLGHKSLKSTQIYARLDIDPVRNSMNKAVKTDMVENIIKKQMNNLDHHKEAFNKIGWFIPPYVALGQLFEIVKKIYSQENFTQDELEQFLSVIYSSNRLAAMLLERYSTNKYTKDYKTIISESISAHFSRLNHVSATGLMPVIEGVIVKIAEENDIETNQGKQKVFNEIAQKCKDKAIKENIGELGEIISMIDSYIEFAEKYLFIKSENYSLEDKTNRHGILHGAYSDLDYGKPINFYKCISAIDFLCFTSGFFGEGASSFVPEETKNSKHLCQHYNELKLVQCNINFD